MLTRSVFWATLAVMYLVLAAITYRGRQEVNKVQFPFASQMEHYFIPTPVASALKSIFVVEILGFILAAAAALYEAVT